MGFNKHWKKCFVLRTIQHFFEHPEKLSEDKTPYFQLDYLNQTSASYLGRDIFKYIHWHTNGEYGVYKFYTEIKSAVTATNPTIFSETAKLMNKELKELAYSPEEEFITYINLLKLVM